MLYIQCISLTILGSNKKNGFRVNLELRIEVKERSFFGYVGKVCFFHAQQGHTSLTKKTALYPSLPGS